MDKDNLFFFNGINGESGDYALPPMTSADLSDFIQGLKSPDNLSELRDRYRQATARTLGVREGIDPLKLDQAGWGIIFPANAASEVKEALKPLIDLRREQAGKYFRLYDGGEGYRPGESKNDFLTRHGAGPGPADPEIVPYYLLLAGSPREIPYIFQSQLDVQYAVGRICFDTPEEYACYARSVVAAELGAARLPRRAVFFGPANPDDPSTQLSAEQLLQPLQKELSGKFSDWEMPALLREQATKRELARMMCGGEAPPLLFTAGHGMEFPLDSPRQLAEQGALLCQDWPGPEEWYRKGPIPAEFAFGANDLTPDAGLAGMVAFFFACYGVGTPLNDDFSQQAFRKRAAIAPYPFSARLPVKMLSHPRGGALAVIGHVERVWGYSFYWEGAGKQTAVFADTLKRLLAGHPVGSALEYFNGRYAELAVVLKDTLEDISFGMNVDALELANLWTACNDARGYSILGDPAVRLQV